MVYYFKGSYVLVDCSELVVEMDVKLTLCM